MGLDNPSHILLLFVLVLIVFGARRLPEIGRSLGSGLREFKQSISGESQPQQPTLPPAPAEQPRPAEQAQASATQGQAQDAFAQREPTATDRS